MRKVSVLYCKTTHGLLEERMEADLYPHSIMRGLHQCLPGRYGRFVPENDARYLHRKQFGMINLSEAVGSASRSGRINDFFEF